MAHQVTKSIIVKGSASAVYNLWANFQNFPQFMKHIKSVHITGPRTSHWVMDGPLGANIDWNAEMTRVEDNKRIAWNSKDGKGIVTTSGQVTFNPLPDNRTEITVTLQYTPPGGKVGELVANWFAHPEKSLTEDLRNFKAFIEGMPSRRLA